MNKFRRIEVHAYRRRVTVVSGAWRPDELFEAQSPPTDDGVTFNESGACEPVAPDSAEGQLILIEAMRTLERRLTPETLAMVHSGPDSLAGTSLTERRPWYRSFRHFLRLKLLALRREVT